ncbi:hypothetical protein DTO164E3_4659 [Paecilomyces variotii]|nr:hypothetical protein DTO164E3_4659 [Paecilomyces variotii]KAJ9204511.1 hypothetical protein DTO032I3_2766 [Paecilomyces variotii]KAJ9278301.1 hypothetical protein DTO021D3_4780 [Paecilomyces variotii]KAJ9344479.1 hypothetical protein DTO027B6_3097 [Paecilomyces variotii]KAJ9380794.1 hypothetical protein DTO063F5_6503 [Paecilomyces variotii]
MFSGHLPSTPTPPPRAGAMNSLNVRKTRNPEDRSSDATMSSTPGLHESPVGNRRGPSESPSNRVVSMEGDQHGSKPGLVKKFFRSFDSRGRKSSIENPIIPISLPMGLEGSTANTSRAPSGDITYGFDNSAQQDRNFSLERRRTFGQLTIPAIVPGVEIVPLSHRIGVEETLLYTYVRVELNLPELSNPDELPHDFPLDIIYIMDNTSSTPPVKQREFSELVFKWVTMLNRDRVRFAVACVNDSPEGGLKYLLRLGKHSRQGAKVEIDKFHEHHLTPRKQEGLMLRKAVSQASHDLLAGDGKALCHIVLVTFEPPDPFPMPKMDRRVGFHTVSPGARFNFADNVPPFGWHVQMTAYPTHTSYIQRIQHIMSHLHTGINAGAVSNLTIKLNAGDGCLIESSANDIKFERLRLGELWTVPIYVRVPAASIKQMVGHDIPEEQMPIRDDENLSIDELFSQLQRMVSMPKQSDPQRIYTAVLEYDYSPVPGTRVSQVATCNVIRIPPDPRTPRRRHNPQGLPYGGPGAPFNTTGPGTPLNATGALNVAGAHLAYGSMQNLRHAAGDPRETPRQGSYGNTSVLKQFPFNQGQPSPMASSAHSQPHPQSFKDRFTRSHENIRSKFKLFSDKQKLQGGLQEDPVPEEPNYESDYEEPHYENIF